MLPLSFFLLAINLSGQVFDQFADGDFHLDPEWIGDVADFEIDLNKELHLNNIEVEDESHLVTGNSLFDKVVWEFYVRLDFNPSSSNYARVYLVSDGKDLEADVNAYYILIGGLDDEISLFRQEGSTHTKVIDGLDGQVATTPEVRIKVIRSDNSRWSLYGDLMGGNNYQHLASAFDDDPDVSSTAFFGVFCDYSKTRADKFYFDDILVDQLRIDSVQVLDPLTFDIYLNQGVTAIEAETISNFSLSSGQIETVQRDDPDSSHLTVELKETDPLVTGDYWIELSSALTLNESDQYQFSFLELEMDTLYTLSDYEIQLVFNDALDKSSAENELNYVIDHGIGNPITSLIEESEPTKVLLTLDEPFLDGVSYQIGIQEVENIVKNSSFDGSKDFTFIIPLNIIEIVPLSSNSISVIFNKQLNVLLAEEEENYLLGPGGMEPTSAVIQDGNNRVYLEFGDVFDENDYTLTINDLEDLDGNLIAENSEAQFYYNPLVVLDVSQSDATTIQLSFNQKVDEVSVENTQHYLIKEAGHPIQANLDLESDSIVYLHFSALFNTSYDLEIYGIKNQIENSEIDQEVIEFLFEAPTGFRHLVINEVLADFTPQIDLPEAEYIEILNVGPSSINLKNFLLNGEVTPDFYLDSGAYVLVVDEDNSSLYGDLENLLALPDFDALTNGGDTVILRDQYGNKIDSISYNTSWYRDEVKDDGGYSLELINPILACSDETNWEASHSETGGTPGRENSVFTNLEDTDPPQIEYAAALGEDQIEMVFSEPVNGNLINNSNLDVSNGFVQNVSIPSYRRLEITLSEDLISEKEYKIYTTSIQDCSGNLNPADSISFYYDVTPPLINDIIVVSENTIALRFHEPLNESIAENEDRYYVIPLGRPDRAILQDSAINRVHLSFDTIFHKSFYPLTFDNLGDTLDNLTEETTVDFEFDDNLDSVYVLAANLLAVDFLSIPKAGVSPLSFFVTEGIGRPSEVLMEKDDSTLVILSFESNFPENKELSLYVEGVHAEEKTLVTPSRIFSHDTRAPSIQEVLVLNDRQIKVLFEERINLISAFSPLQYELEKEIYPLDISSLDSKEVILTFKEAIPVEQELNLQIKDISDLYGNAFGTRNISFIYDPKPPQIVKVHALDDKRISIHFSERLDTATAYHLSNYLLGEQHPILVHIQGPDSLQLHLTFDSTIPLMTTVPLEVHDLEDKNGNSMDSTLNNLNTLNPMVASTGFKTDSTLLISFSRSMDESAAELNNYLLNGSYPLYVEEQNDSEFLLEFFPGIVSGDSMEISMNRMNDVTGHSFRDTTYWMTFDHQFFNWDLIDSKIVELDFNTQFGDVSADLFRLDTIIPQQVFVDIEDQSVLRLFFRDTLAVNQPMNLSWTGLQDLYSRTLPDISIPILIDKVPPIVTEVKSDYLGWLTITFNEQVSDHSIFPGHFSISTVEGPIEINQVSETTYSLLFDHLDEGVDYMLYSRDIFDLHQNVKKLDSIGFTYTPPSIPDRGDIVLNELMIDPTPEVGLPDIEYIELFNKSDQSYNLRSLRISDISTVTSLPDYDLLPGSYIVLSEDSVAEDHYVLVDNLPTLTNATDSIAITNINGMLIDHVSYSRDWYGNTQKDDGGFSLELINPYSDCPGIVNWTVSENERGGTPGERNSVYNLLPDTIKPSIVSYQLEDNQLIIYFSEAMDASSVLTGSYLTDNFEIGSIEVAGDYSDYVVITINDQLVNGRLYQLAIEDVMDCSGNPIKPSTITFGRGRGPGFNELIITEIMVDPDPVVNLPNSEYLEIFNSSEDLISLEGVLLEDATGYVELPSMSIPSQQYIILCPVSEVEKFEIFGQTAGVSGWRSLNNSGELLTLWYHEQLVFYLDYSNDWYSELSDGGISLEMRDPNNPCGGAVNWGSSEHVNGGTPGKPNSIREALPDQFGSEFVKIEIASPSGVDVVFSEPLIWGIEDLLNIAITPSQAKVSSVSHVFPERERLHLEFVERLTPKVNYQIVISGLQDCNGNVSEIHSTFVLPEAADSADLLINEILFNPRQSGVDFVELINPSDKNINLKGWVLGRRKEAVTEGEIIASSDLIIKPGQYMVLTPDKGQLKQEYPKAQDDFIIEMSQFPTFPNESATVVLMNNEQQLIDEFTYHEDMHFSLLGSLEGVSLERISFDVSTQDVNNWQSASESEGFATPGYENSQAKGIKMANSAIEISPKVFVPANSGSMITQDFTTINYHFISGGKLANVNIYNRDGRVVKTIASGTSLSTNGFFRWDGTTNSGQVVSMGMYLIVFEAYDSNGERDVLKETVVVGR